MQDQPNLHSFDLYNDYPLPDWSSEPTKDYFLEIMKSGVILEEKKLNDKSFYLIGRLPNLSDIVLEHPSISRKHAVLQHKNNGELYVYDLESTHGTFVNTRKIPPRVFVKLNIGDMVKFGASLRVYILRCLELENQSKGVDLSTDIGLIKSSLNIPKTDQNKTKKLYLKMLKSYEATENGGQRERHMSGKKKENDENEITWGISDEEAVYNYQDENEFKMEPSILRQLPDLNEKQLEKIEQFEVKLNKYQAIESEYEELTKRERKDFGLDEISKAKKENLEKKIQETAQQLETLEETLKLMIFKEKTEKRKLEKVLQEDTYNDDEYFDRTLETKKVKKDPADIPTESQKKEQITYDFQTLKQKLEELINRRNDLNVKILDFSDQKNGVEEELDELEKFMKENQSALDLQLRKKLMVELESVNKEIEETKKLLRIVRPNYEIQEKKAVFKISEKPKETSKPSNDVTKKSENFPKPHEKVTKALEKLKTLSKEYAEREKNITDFKDLEKYRVFDDEDDEKSKEKIPEEIQEPQKPKLYGVSAKPLPRNLKEKDVEKKKGIENVNWIPPVNQKGDGLTDLNKKYGY